MLGDISVIVFKCFVFVIDKILFIKEVRLEVGVGCIFL